MGKTCRVAVIDSGYTSEISTNKNIIGAKRIYEDNNCCLIDDNCYDNLGHGTAVLDLLAERNQNIEFVIFKVFDNQFECSEKILYFCLEYINKNIDCDLIHISAGLTNCDDISGLHELIKQITNKKTNIIASYDNDGAMSYPAAFKEVIGVDILPNSIKNQDFLIVENSAVDALVSDRFYRTKWSNNKNIIIRGTSFASTVITANAAEIIAESPNKLSKKQLVEKLKQKCNNVIRFPKKRKSGEYKPNKMNIRNAILFPFNKEMHSLIAFYEQLQFNVVGCYDTKYNMNLGKSLQEIIHFKELSIDLKLDNYLNIDWESDFDTVIIGHCDQINSLIKKDIKKEIIELCIKHNKQIYSLDNIDCYLNNTKNPDNAFFPKVYPDITSRDFGKLYRYNKPIVGIFGTSSKQGKFSLLLSLRERFMKAYDISVISTEPSGYLFDLDYVYPMGYNSTVYTKTYESVIHLNRIVNQLEQNNPDLIMFNSQSGTIPYDYSNCSSLTFHQNELLTAMLPDAAILAINPFDDINYVKKTISYIEIFGDGKVIALVLYPFKNASNSLGLSNRKIPLTEDEINTVKDYYSVLNIPIFNLSQPKDIDMLFESVIIFFAQGD